MSNIILRSGDRGVAVVELQRALASLGRTIDAGDRRRKLFGTATATALREFQAERSLPPTAELDDASRDAIERALRELGPYSVGGCLTDREGEPIAGATIYAIDLDLRRDQVLGKAETDLDGLYEIRYSPEQFARAEKGTADLVVRAMLGDTRIAESTTRFDAPETARVDLRAEVLRGGTEYAQLVASIEPVLDGVTPGDLTEAEITFVAADLAPPKTADDGINEPEQDPYLHDSVLAQELFDRAMTEVGAG
ncbi:MAG: peptidoglycan-binding protein, partial [Kofleriaceae bacterium]